MKNIDPMCGMKGTIPAHGHYFCSEHCIKKYEQEHNIPKEKEYCPSCNIKPGTPWYKEKLYIFTIITLVLLIITYFF
jgi:NAD-dependent SIR2 family protein deacetylase